MVPLPLLLVLLWSAAAMTSDEDDSQLRVRTTQGWLQGSYTTTRGGRKVRQFLGIRYAKSPDGERSFKSPEPVDPWDGVLNATAECDLCMQQFTMIEATRFSVQGSVDCLCMNIFIPIIKDKNKKLPVIFYNYGSAYTGLDYRKEYYGPEMLLDSDQSVCLVVPASRVGILGYLSTEDEVIPGNWGLKDLALALKWVNQNIHFFGGDPNSITSMGESSGGGNVHLQLFSPLTRDLFHRAIMQSGSGFCSWGFSLPGEHIKKSKMLAKYMNCPFSPSSKFLNCLRKAPMAKIVNTTNLFRMDIEADPVANSNPCIEPKTVKDAFLTENPYLLCSTKPLLAGYNYAEGMMKVASLTSGDVKAKFDEWNEKFFNITPYQNLYYNRMRESDLAKVTQRIRDFYFGPHVKVIDPSMVRQMVQMFGDFWFTMGTIEATLSHCGPKWFYHFNFNTSASVVKNIYNNDMYAGAAHLDDLMYLFPMAMTTGKVYEPNSHEHKLSLTMVKLWTSFVHSSVPTAAGVTWNPVKSSALEYLDITNSGFTMEKNPIADRLKFHESLPYLTGLSDGKKEKTIYN